MGLLNLMNMATPIEHLDFSNDYIQGGKIKPPKDTKKVSNGISHASVSQQMTTSLSEPAYGKRLIAQTVDDLATSEPDRVWATVPKGEEISDGFRDVTFRELANVVDSVAWWLESKIGRSDQFEVLAYLGLSDVRYAILFFAAVKCGYVVSINSYSMLWPIR